MNTILKKSDNHQLQDAALQGRIEAQEVTIPFAVISDGCSSGYITEYGSMLVALCFKKALFNIANEENDFTVRDLDRPINVYKHFIECFRRACSLLSIEDDTALATLNATYIYDDQVHFIMAGDGYQFYKKFGGEIVIAEHSFTDNAPFYPAYEMQDRIVEYINNFPTQKRLIKNNNNLTHYSAQDLVYCNSKSLEGIERIGISSDGLGSYESGDKIYSSMDICEQLCEVKNYNGAFLERTFNRVDKALTKSGYINFDDVSVAMIKVEL